MNNYLTPLNIPAGKSGNAEIVREVKSAGTRMILGNLRTAMFGQGAHKDLSWPHETTWHQLLIDGSRMMSDWPIEQRQHNAELKGMRGHVLVGGLGLGYAATVLAGRKSVKSVTVVEINPDVVRLVAPYTRGTHYLPRCGPPVKVVQADLMEWLKDYDGPAFDHAFYDIWASDGEGTFHGTVEPLYRLSEGKVKHQPVNWNEDVMRGQLCSALLSRLMMLKPEAAAIRPKQWDSMSPLWEDDGTDLPWHNWAVPFFRWWKDEAPSDNRAEIVARIYAGTYGRWGWNELWQLYVSGGKAVRS